MAEVSKKLRKALVKGMETIGSTASGIANSARYKVDEMNLINNRKELLNKVALTAYTCWQQGAVLPPEMAELLQQVADVDKQLDVMRAEHIESVKPAQPAYGAVPTLEVDDVQPDHASNAVHTVEELIGNMDSIGQALDEFTRDLMEQPDKVQQAMNVQEKPASAKQPDDDTPAYN